MSRVDNVRGNVDLCTPARSSCAKVDVQTFVPSVLAKLCHSHLHDVFIINFDLVLLIGAWLRVGLAAPETPAAAEPVGDSAEETHEKAGLNRCSLQP